MASGILLEALQALTIMFDQPISLGPASPLANVPWAVA